MARYCAKLWLLVWKNWKLQVNHPWHLFCQLAFSLAGVLLVFLLRLLFPVAHFPGVTRFPAFDPADLDLALALAGGRAAFTRNKGLPSAELAWSPQEAAPAAFAHDAEAVMQVASEGAFTLRRFSSPAQLKTYMHEAARLRQDDPGDGPVTLAGVVLADDAHPATPQLCSPRLKVTLRFPSELRQERSIQSEIDDWMTDSLFPEFQSSGPRDFLMDTGPMPGYTKEGFTALQARVARAVAQHCTKQSRRPLQPLHGKARRAPGAWPEVRLRRFSYPTHHSDSMAEILPMTLNFALDLAFLLNLLLTVKYIVMEKKSRMKVTLEIMGVPTSLHWIAWFIKSMNLLLLNIVFIVMILKFPTKNGAILKHSSPLVLIITFVLFAASLTLFAFMVSVFFSSAFLATLIANNIYLLIPSVLNKMEKEEFSLTKILLICLLFNGALRVSFNIIMKHEGIGVGQQWTNMWSTPSPDYPVALGVIWLMFLLSCFVYVLITLYAQAVFPGKYGVPKPWNFLCQKAFWRPQPLDEGQAVSRLHTNDPRHFEEEPFGGIAGARLNAVTKVFPGNKTAVKNLNLNVYEGQITVLLGPNGAGKTTTISMMTGMAMPTTGSVTINGFDLRSNTQKAREAMGVCMEHDVVFLELSVHDHLYFYCKLKGLTGNELKEEIALFLKLMHMEDMKNRKARSLTAGMQRKLAVCTALCGKNKTSWRTKGVKSPSEAARRCAAQVVVLDEPSLGMDPAARRALWQLLREMRPGRTLLLSTHMMEEAEALADRVAVLAGGQLHCVGSPSFLKRRLGDGYHLAVVKGRRCTASHVTKLVATHIGSVKIVRETGFEIVYQLDAAQASGFEPMLAALERKASDLDVITFHVSVATLEEVFFKVSQEHERGRQAAQPLTTRPTPVAGDSSAAGRCHQVRAMCLKKSAVARHRWLTLLLFLAIPSLTPVLMFLASDVAVHVPQLPALSMRLQSYKNSKTVIAVGTGDKNMAKNYEDLVTGSYITILDNETDPIDAFEKYMLDQYNADRGKARQHYIIGASFENDTITGWFNDQPHHALPLTLNMLHNALLKPSGISINIVNHPLPFSPKSQSLLLVKASSYVEEIVNGIMLLSCYFILFPTRERLNKSKHMQMVSGLNVLIFWGVHFIFDFFCFLVASALIIVVFGFIHLKCLSTARTFAVLVCFVCANLPFLYTWSLLLRSKETGLTVLLVVIKIGFIHSTFNKLTSIQTQEREQASVLGEAHYIFQWIYSIIPIYTLMDALSNLQQYCSSSDFCSNFKPNCSRVKESFCCPGKCAILGCVSSPPNYFQWTAPGIGSHIVLFFLWGLIYCIILLISDSYRLNECCVYLERCRVRMARCVKDKYTSCCKRRKYQEENVEEDKDVLNEKQKINSSNETQLKKYSVALRGVTKYYSATRAVNDISVGIEKGEIFGLLGFNGAGKTSIFKMMTGDVRITKGKGYLMSYNIQKEIKKVQKNMGYCSQIDALIRVMTVRETLRMYLLLRGYPVKEIAREIRTIADNFDLIEDIDKKVEDCSQSDKRKLSVAIALIGEPPVVFLDEPTAGVDPIVRRKVWEAMMRIREAGHSVILATDNMEECEVLCTRVAIMINGTFKCLGPIQHLKNKFVEGNTLIVTVKKGYDVPQRVNTVKDFISRTFPGAVLKQEYLLQLSYNIPRKTYSWSQMFGIMEKAKKELDIEEYSLEQTSLEQVFLHLASLESEMGYVTKR